MGRAHFHACASQSRLNDAVDCVRDVALSEEVEHEAGRTTPIFSDHIRILITKALQCLSDVDEELQTAASYIKQSCRHVELALEGRSNE